MLVKPGVDLTGVQPQLTYAARVYDALHRYVGLGPATITGGIERAPGRVWNTLHPHGLALDFRTSTMPPGWPAEFAQVMTWLLGEDYDVVLERDHIHIELARAWLLD